MNCIKEDGEVREMGGTRCGDEVGKRTCPALIFRLVSFLAGRRG